MLTVEALKEIYTALGGDADAEFSLNVEGLKAIFTALGGDPAEVADLDDIASVCSKIATVASGGGKLSTASVTINNNTGSSLTMYAPIAMTDDAVARPFLTTSGTYHATVIMYDGNGVIAQWSPTVTESQITVSGKAQKIGTTINVTGDCEITISA